MKHFQNTGPQNDFEVLAYFCQNVWKTPFTIEGVYSENELFLKYSDVGIDTMIGYDAGTLLRNAFTYPHLIICFTGSSLIHDIPVLDISQNGWQDKHFDTLLAGVDERIAELEQERLEFIKMRQKGKEDLFQCCLVIYDRVALEQFVDQKYMVEILGWPKETVQRAHTTLRGLRIVSASQTACMMDRDQVIRILDKHIDLL